MTAAALSKISHNHIASIPAAIKALAAMEHQLSQTSTYDEIRKLVDQAEALKLLFSDIDIVKAEAEDVILAAGARIGEEIAKVPKANAPSSQGPIMPGAPSGRRRGDSSVRRHEIAGQAALAEERAEPCQRRLVR